MKIIELIPHLHTGGGEKFVVDLSNSLADKGHDCTLLSMYNPMPQDVLRSYIQDNVKTDSLAKRPGIDFILIYKILRYVTRHKPDVVHAHLASITYIFLAALFCRKTKFYATIHSEAKREAGKGISLLIRKILFRTKLVTAVTISEESEKSFELLYHFPTVIIANGSSNYKIIVDELNKYTKYREGVDYLFCYAGRIHGVKNPLMLVKAFNKVLNKGINARLVIAGRSADDKIFEQLKTYLSDKIVYIGELSDVRALMSVSDAFCLSSKMEGMPITIIEAFSVGCVPIVTPVGGCINMIKNGVNGFISSAIDEDSYCNSILEFVNLDLEKRNNISQSGLQDYGMKFSIDSTAENYLNLFNYGK